MRIDKAAFAAAAALAGLVVAGTGTAAVAADNCAATRRQPTDVVRMWLATGARGMAAPCRLTVVHFDPSDPPVLSYRVGYVRPLAGQGEPGHRLYAVLMVGPERAGTYLIDLRPHAGNEWLIDLWAET